MTLTKPELEVAQKPAKAELVLLGCEEVAGISRASLEASRRPQGLLRRSRASQDAPVPPKSSIASLEAPQPSWMLNGPLGCHTPYFHMAACQSLRPSLRALGPGIYESQGQVTAGLSHPSLVTFAVAGTEPKEAASSMKR